MLACVSFGELEEKVSGEKQNANIILRKVEQLGISIKMNNSDEIIMCDELVQLQPDFFGGLMA